MTSSQDSGAVQFGGATAFLVLRRFDLPRPTVGFGGSLQLTLLGTKLKFEVIGDLPEDGSLTLYSEGAAAWPNALGMAGTSMSVRAVYRRDKNGVSNVTFCGGLVMEAAQVAQLSTVEQLESKDLRDPRCVLPTGGGDALLKVSGFAANFTGDKANALVVFSVAATAKALLQLISKLAPEVKDVFGRSVSVSGLAEVVYTTRELEGPMVSQIVSTPNVTRIRKNLNFYASCELGPLLASSVGSQVSGLEAKFFVEGYVESKTSYGFAVRAAIKNGLGFALKKLGESVLLLLDVGTALCYCLYVSVLCVCA